MALTDFTNSLPMLLYRAVDAVMPRFRRIFNEFGITEQQWRVLRVLAEAESSSLRELSGYCLIPAPSLVGIVDRLQTAGYVTRAPSSIDRRQVALGLTPAGRDLQRRVAPRVSAVYAVLMQEVGPREWIRLGEGLQALADTASASADADPDG